MVEATILPGILDRQDISYVLYDTDRGGVTTRVSTYTTELSITDIVTLTAVDDPITHLYKSMSEGVRVTLGAREQM